MEQHIEAFLVLLGYNLRGFITRVSRGSDGAPKLSLIVLDNQVIYLSCVFFFCVREKKTSC